MRQGSVKSGRAVPDKRGAARPPGVREGSAARGDRLPGRAYAGVEDVDRRVDVVVRVVRHGLQAEAGRVGGDGRLFDEVGDQADAGDEAGGRATGGGVDIASREIPPVTW